MIFQTATEKTWGFDSWNCPRRNVKYVLIDFPKFKKILKNIKIKKKPSKKKFKMRLMREYTKRIIRYFPNANAVWDVFLYSLDEDPRSSPGLFFSISNLSLLEKSTCIDISVLLLPRCGGIFLLTFSHQPSPLMWSYKIVIVYSQDVPILNNILQQSFLLVQHRGLILLKSVSSNFPIYLS